MKIILTFVFIILTTNLMAQTIADVYYAMPNEYIFDLSTAERQQLAATGKLIKNDTLYSLTATDSLKGSFVCINNDRQILELEIWMYDKKALAALSLVNIKPIAGHYGIGRSYRDQHDFKFFDYSDGRLHTTDREVFKGYHSNFDKTRAALATELTNGLAAPESFKLTLSLHSWGGIRISYDESEYPELVEPLPSIKVLRWNKDGNFKLKRICF